MKPTVHIPVLLEEVVASLGEDLSGKVFVDGTFGGGGYTEALLRSGAECVISFDRDDVAIKRGAWLKEKYKERLILVNDCFSTITEHVKANGYDEIDGVVLDLGFSSDQLDDYERGFAFKHDGPLDMRMSRTGETAADVVNTYSEKEIAQILWVYGEEKKSRQIAKKIVSRRVVSPFERTSDLAQVIEEVVPAWTLHGKSPAMRTFQALRIHVNREMEELERVLPQAKNLLAKKGHLSVVTFHSLEDRVVKRFFKEHGRIQAKNKYAEMSKIKKQEEEKMFEVVGRKALEPTEKEILENSRSRSAKLRVLKRI